MDKLKFFRSREELNVAKPLLNPHKWIKPTNQNLYENFHAPETREIILPRLEKALIHGKLEVLYRLTHHLLSEEPTGVDAVCSFRDESKHRVFLANEIDDIKNTTLLTELADAYLEKVCAQSSEWLKIKKRIKTTVEVSVLEYLSENFLDMFNSYVRVYDIDPSLIRFELPESLLLGNMGKVIAFSNKAENIGAKVSLKGVGRLITNLSYLNNFSFNGLKIDKAFIKNLDGDTGNEQIVKTIASAAEALGVHLVAEGIETRRQRNLLKDMGCKFGQGSFFSDIKEASDIFNIQ